MLVYLGGGSIPGIPARDLQEDKIKGFGGEKFLIETGLYRKGSGTKTRSGGSENKMITREESEVKDE